MWLFVFFAGAILLHYGLHRLFSDAPEPDGLFTGERVIEGFKAQLSTGRRRVAGNAYLTDLRVIWVPTAMSRSGDEGSTEHPDAVTLNHSEVRRVLLLPRLWDSSLTLVTPEGDYALHSSVRGFGSWRRYLLQHCRSLLDDDAHRDPPSWLHVRDEAIRYARKASLAAGTGLVVLYMAGTFYVLDPSSDPLALFLRIGVPIAMLGYVLWDSLR